MADSNGWSLVVAIYGALTGTVACARQAWQWKHDKPKLTIKAHIEQTNVDAMGNLLPVGCVVLVVSAVNTGHRTGYIKSITVPLSGEAMPIPQSATPELIDALRKGHMGNTLLIYGRRDDAPAEVKPDGGTFTQRQQLKKLSPLRPNEDDPKLATITVELTNGEKLFTTVAIWPVEMWPANDY